MNARGQYGTSRIGQFMGPGRPGVDPLSAYYLKKNPPKAEISDTGAAILLASIAAIVVIGIVGAKRGMRLM